MTKQFTILYSFLLSLFVLLVIILCWYSRLATDDYWFIWDVRNHGILQGVYSQYMDWCGRFAAVFLMDLIFYFLDVNQKFYFLVPLISFLFLFLGVSKLLSEILSFSDIIANRSQKVILALSFTALAFLLTVDFGETWFWYCSLSSYLWSVIAFIWVLFFLVQKKSSIIDYLFFFVCLVYVSGASEVYTLFYSALFFYWIALEIKRRNTLKDFISSSFQRKLLIATFVLVLGGLSSYLAPGNFVRSYQFPIPTLRTTLLNTLRMIIKLVGWFLPQKLPFLFLFSLPFYLIGNSLPKKNNDGILKNKKVIFQLLSILVLGSIFVFFCIAFIMSQSGEYRIWFIITIMLAVFSCYVFFFIGYNNTINLENSTIILIVIVCSFFFLMYSSFQVYRVVNYAVAVDKRIQQIVQSKNQMKENSILVLQPLPASGMLYSAEITHDTNHFTNQEMKLGYNLKFNVIIENE